MNLPVHGLNWQFGWWLILSAFATGAAIGLFFHRPDFLGGYGSFRRRLFRLGHVAQAALGMLNLIYALGPCTSRVASLCFVIGGVTMPAVCFLAGWREKWRHLFLLPVLALSAAVALTIAAFANSAMLLPGAQPLDQRPDSTLGRPWSRGPVRCDGFGRSRLAMAARISTHVCTAGSRKSMVHTPSVRTPWNHEPQAGVQCGPKMISELINSEIVLAHAKSPLTNCSLVPSAPIPSEHPHPRDGLHWHDGPVHSAGFGRLGSVWTSQIPTKVGTTNPRQ